MLSGLLAPPSRTVRAVMVEKRSGLGASRPAWSRCSTRLTSSSRSIVAHLWPLYGDPQDQPHVPQRHDGHWAGCKTGALHHLSERPSPVTVLKATLIVVQPIGTELPTDGDAGLVDEHLLENGPSSGRLEHDEAAEAVPEDAPPSR